MSSLINKKVYVIGISTPGHERIGSYGRVIDESAQFYFVENFNTKKISLEWKHHVRESL